MAHALVKQESVEWEMQKSADQSKTFVYTKKRGYDVTRNPHLNKVKRQCFSNFTTFFKKITFCVDCLLIRQQGSGYQFREELYLDLKGHTLSLSAVAVCVKSKSVCSLQVLVN